MDGSPLAELLEKALAAHKAGWLDQALQGYEQVLQMVPKYPPAWNLLGALKCQQGDYLMAVQCFQIAVQNDPTQASFLNNLGEAFRRWGKPVEATECLQRALAIAPQNSEALNNLGIIYQSQGKLAEATACYEQVLGLGLHTAEAYNNLGTLCKDQSELDRAIGYFQQALQLNPAYAMALNNLGAVYTLQAEYAEARKCLERCLQLNPDYAEAWNNLGSVLQSEEHLSAALPCYQAALARKPGYPDGAVNLAACQAALGNLAAAEEAFTRAFQLTGKDGLRIRAAIALPPILESAEQIDPLRRRLLEKLDELAALPLQVDDPIKEISHNHFYLAYQGRNDRELNSRLATVQSQACPVLQFTADHCQRSAALDAGRPLRIGVASRYFYQHSIGRLMIGLVERLSRPRFHVTAVRLPGKTDAWTRRIDAAADAVICTPRQLAAAQRAIAAQEFDVLLYADVGMDPLAYFLAFARLAPVQCLTWGHPVTCGIPNIDYFLSAQHLEAPGAEEHYSEKLVRLSDPPTYFHPLDFGPSDKTREAFGLSAHGTRYLCPQSLFKIHPDFDRILDRILAGDPGSQVVLLAAAEPAWQRALVERFRKSMPETCSRVQFLPRQSPRDLLRLMQLADVILDTVHFSGGLTSIESFSVGQPVVTLPGEFLRGRVTYGYYRQIGVHDCIARDADDYVRLALRLAHDQAWRRDLQEEVRRSQHKIYENQQHVDEIERFLVNATRAAANDTP